MTTTNNNSRASRIPATLQAIFLASNRGKDVHKPPPKSVASKVFFSNWLFQRSAGSKRKLAKKPSKVGVDSMPHTATTSVQEKCTKTVSPQTYLDTLLLSRGYSTHRHASLNSAYYNKPTPHQRASYDVHLIQVIRQGNVEQFRQLVSHGLSSNPCNQFSESIAHTVCRHGNHAMLKVLMHERGCDVRTADDYGRVPMHDACWAAHPSFEVVEELFQADPNLFLMVDTRGHCPLNYVPKEYYGAWVAFLESKKDVWWPQRNNETAVQEKPTALLSEAPNTRPVPDPVDAFSLELSQMVSSGRMHPEEALYLHEADAMTAATCESDDYDSEFDDDSEFDEEDSEDSEDNEELAVLLEGLPISIAVH